MSLTHFCGGLEIDLEISRPISFSKVRPEWKPGEDLHVAAWLGAQVTLTIRRQVFISGIYQRTTRAALDLVNEARHYVQCTVKHSTKFTLGLREATKACTYSTAQLISLMNMSMSCDNSTNKK